MNFDNFPVPSIVKMSHGNYYKDPIRQKLVMVTPEETIRQKVIQFLLKELNVPKNMVEVEMRLDKYGIETNDRADIIINGYNKSENIVNPIVVIECKAPDVALSEYPENQMFSYADRLNTPYCMLTNGIETKTFYYDEKKNQYYRIKILPEYKEMITGKYDLEEEIEIYPRLTLEEIKEHPYAYEEIGYSTKENKAMMCVNLIECLLYPEPQMPDKQFKIFKLIEDYGARFLSVGNAGGGGFDDAYRSFLIEYKNEKMIVSIGLSTYVMSSKEDIIKTSLNVAIERENRPPHHSLQLVIDDNAEIVKNNIKFYHHGRIGISNAGSGKVKELQELVFKYFPRICYDDMGNKRFYLGSLTFDRLWTIKDPEVTELIENLISYSLIRDDYRSVKKQLKVF